MNRGAGIDIMPRNRYSLSYNMRTYYIIDRTGREVLRAPHIENVTAQGYALIRRDDWSYAVFHASDESVHPLPTSLGGHPLVYELEEDYLIALCLVPKRVGITRRRNTAALDTGCWPPLPEGKCIVASYVADIDGTPRFAPMPYRLHPFYHGTACAEDSEKRGVLVNEKGEIIHTFPDVWRNIRRLKPENNEPEYFSMQKHADAGIDSLRRPEYVADRHLSQVRGPFLHVHNQQEGLRLVTNMDESYMVVDESWNTVFRFPENTIEGWAGATGFCHGHLPYRTAKGLRSGLLDRQGTIVCKPIGKYLDYIGEDFWFYSKGGLVGVMRETGEIVTPPRFKYFSDGPARHGLIAVGNKGFSCGYINYQWEWGIPARFSGCYNFVHPEYSLAYNDI